MTAHKLFYYPYASLTDQQLPLFKVAALYFDKLIVLDPAGASRGTVGADDVARRGITLLKDAGILEVVAPGDALADYGDALTRAVRRDMADREFLELCHVQARATQEHRWTLALAKVPQQLQADQAMRYLMGDVAREVARTAASFAPPTGGSLGEYGEYVEYAEYAEGFEERREGYQHMVDYRCANFPLALGESIMMNHALFTGMLHAGATPVTDDPFHSQVLGHKLERIAQEPEIQRALASTEAQRMLKEGQFVVAALRDSDVQLPILNPALPLDEILEYRHRNADALAQVRRTLGLMARSIQHEPWSADFAKEIETKTIPGLIQQIELATEARDAWLGTGATRRCLKAAGVVVGAASAVLTLVTSATPAALAAAALGVAAGAIPGAEWLLDRSEGRKKIEEHGLHYLLRADTSVPGRSSP